MISSRHLAIAALLPLHSTHSTISDRAVGGCALYWIKRSTTANHLPFDDFRALLIASSFSAARRRPCYASRCPGVPSSSDSSNFAMSFGSLALERSVPASLPASRPVTSESFASLRSASRKSAPARSAASRSFVGSPPSVAISRSNVVFLRKAPRRSALKNLAPWRSVRERSACLPSSPSVSTHL